MNLGSLYPTLLILLLQLIFFWLNFQLPDRPAANHIRAVFGGMEIGLGMLLLYFCLVKNGVRNGLIVLAFSIGVTSLSRLYGIVFDGGGDMSNILSFVADFTFAVMALILIDGIKNKKI